MHTVEFVGLNPQGGDNTAFIDEVAITAAADSVSDGSFEAPGLAAGDLPVRAHWFVLAISPERPG